MDETSHNTQTERITATALGYDPESDQAPVILASGRGKIAEQIIQIAKENNVPIHDDPILAQTLARIQINDVIPPELYLVVAQIFAYIQRVRSNLNQDQMR